MVPEGSDDQPHVALGKRLSHRLVFPELGWNLGRCERLTTDL
jgi:hypothetical protein